jgi:hypothetical protein
MRRLPSFRQHSDNTPLPGCTFLILEAGQGFGPLLAETLAEQGCRVIAAADDPPENPAATNVIWTYSASVAMLAAERGPFDTIIFNAPALDKGALIDAEDGGAGLIEAVDADVRHFLRDLQDAVKALIGQAGAQVWVLLQEDSFDYCVDVPIAPIGSGARLSALRSLAKECGRLGMAFNVILFQPTDGMIGAESLRQARNGLKIYGLRWRPLARDTVIGAMVDHFLHSGAAANGSVIHLGAGIHDHNF